MSNFSDMDNVFIMDHPLIQHKISILRNKETGTNEFRKLIEEIAVLMGFEALRDLPLEDVEVETPIETCRTPMISGKKLAVVPVLRAGLGMVNGITTLVPSAKIGHIGLYRDPVTHEPHEYYCKLPDPIDQRLIVMVDHPVTEEVHLLEHPLLISLLKTAEHPLLIIAGKSLVIDTILGKILYMDYPAQASV